MSRLMRIAPTPSGEERRHGGPTLRLARSPAIASALSPLAVVAPVDTGRRSAAWAAPACPCPRIFEGHRDDLHVVDDVGPGRAVHQRDFGPPRPPRLPRARLPRRIGHVPRLVRAAWHSAWSASPASRPCSERPGGCSKTGGWRHPAAHRRARAAALPDRRPGARRDRRRLRYPAHQPPIRSPPRPDLGVSPLAEANAVLETQTRPSLAAHITRGTAQDSPQSRPAVRAAVRACPIDMPLAEGGNDDDHSHAYVRLAPRIHSTVIRLKRRNPIRWMWDSVHVENLDRTDLLQVSCVAPSPELAVRVRRPRPGRSSGDSATGGVRNWTSGCRGRKAFGGMPNIESLCCKVEAYEADETYPTRGVHETARNHFRGARTSLHHPDPESITRSRSARSTMASPSGMSSRAATAIASPTRARPSALTPRRRPGFTA